MKFNSPINNSTIMVIIYTKQNKSSSFYNNFLSKFFGSILIYSFF